MAEKNRPSSEGQISVMEVGGRVKVVGGDDDGLEGRLKRK